MPDPRQSIPDLIHTDASGDQWLIRTPHLSIWADRQPAVPRVSLRFAGHSVRGLDEHGHAILRPAPPVEVDRQYDMAELPPELAALIAMWMAEQAQERGLPLLLPQIDPTATAQEPTP